MTPTSVALVVRNGRVLVLLRGSTAPWYPNAWNLPGGSCEDGESPAEGAARECLEESGLRYDPSEMRALATVDMGADGWLYPFVMTAREGDEIHICWESSDYRWIGLDDLEGMPFVPYVRYLIRTALGASA